MIKNTLAAVSLLAALGIALPSFAKPGGAKADIGVSADATVAAEGKADHQDQHKGETAHQDQHKGEEAHQDKHKGKDKK